LPGLAVTDRRSAKRTAGSGSGARQSIAFKLPAELLGAEMEERERHRIERRIKEARLPRILKVDEVLAKDSGRGLVLQNSNEFL
jgi:hypothetical protein